MAWMRAAWRPLQVRAAARDTLGILVSLSHAGR
jgi:hypothetical protein